MSSLAAENESNDWSTLVSMSRFGPAERTITANFGNRLELPLRVFKYPECRFRTLMMYLSPHGSVFGKAITYGPAEPFCGSPSVDEQWEKRIVFIKGDDALSDRTDIGNGGLNLGIVDRIKRASDCYACQGCADRNSRGGLDQRGCDTFAIPEPTCESFEGLHQPLLSAVKGATASP